MVTGTGTRASRASRSFWLRLLRSLTVGVGICSILWAFSSLAAYQAGAPFEGAAKEILRGKSYDATTLVELKRQLDSMSADQIRPAAVSAAVVRMKLLEVKLTEGAVTAGSPDVADVGIALVAALSRDPSNSYLWLADYWLARLRGDTIDHAGRLLRMSYVTGPNEAWVAQRRNPIALESWASLPADLIKQILSEFASLVQSRLYGDAASIVAGPGWPIHQQLLNRLAPLDEVDRHAMARALAAKNLDGVDVPGIDEHPSRPY